MKSRPLFHFLIGTVLLFLSAQHAHAFNFNIADGDVYGPDGLISAINTANSNNQNDTIILAVGGTYTLTVVDNTNVRGPSGLPIIGSDNGHNLTIDGGNGATIERMFGSPEFRILQIGQNTNVAIGGVTISGGDASTGHGGGAIYNNQGKLTVQECTLRDNIATGVDGGAILNLDGTLTVRYCTLSGNSASGVGGGGGGIGNFYGMATVENCTFSGNTATSGSSIFNSGTLVIAGCTFSHGAPANAGIKNKSVAGSAGSLTLSNTILKAVNIPNLLNENGTISSLGYNLSSDNGGGFLTGPADQINTDPMLDTLGLRDHGGPTQTIALLGSSLALDKGKSFGLTTDQRGQTRQVDLPGFDSAPGGDASDIGAFETTDPVQAGSAFLVTTANDHDDDVCGVLDCTLREAIKRANAMEGTQTITFGANVAGTIVLQSLLGILQITDGIVIDGPGPGTLAVSGNGTLRVFHFSGAGSHFLSGLTIRDGRSVGATGKGGGIFNVSTLTVTDCAFAGHQARGPAATTPGQIGGRASGGAVFNSGTLTLNRCSFSGNTASGGKGANLTTGFVAGNGGAADGGAVFNNSAATLTITNCTFASNSGLGGGGGNNTTGGLESPGKGGAANGGGVFNNSAATLTITNCTFASNSGLGGVGGNNTNYGGGNGGNGNGGVFNQGTMTMTACTLGANTGTGGAGGLGHGQINNGANGTGRGGLTAGGGTSTVRNTISAGNTGNAGADANGSFMSEGYNLIGNGDFSSGFNQAGDQTGTTAAPINAHLGSLQNYGGPTDTMALLTGSPAFDQGKSFGLTTDQRGRTRPTDIPSIVNSSGGDGSDIGAFETGGTLVPISAISRKTHGAAGPFNINLPLSGAAGVECRTGGASGIHQLTMTFAAPVSISSASVTSGAGSVSSYGVGGSKVNVSLTGVTNAQRVVITLFGASDGSNTNNVAIPMSVLLADTTGSGSVNSSDIGQTKSKSGQTASASNFRTDVTVSGSINASDIGLVKSKSGTALP